MQGGWGGKAEGMSRLPPGNRSNRSPDGQGIKHHDVPHLGVLRIAQSKASPYDRGPAPNLNGLNDPTSTLVVVHGAFKVAMD